MHSCSVPGRARHRGDLTCSWLSVPAKSPYARLVISRYTQATALLVMHAQTGFLLACVAPESRWAHPSHGAFFYAPAHALVPAHPMVKCVVKQMVNQMVRQTSRIGCAGATARKRAPSFRLERPALSLTHTISLTHTVGATCSLTHTHSLSHTHTVGNAHRA